MFSVNSDTTEKKFLALRGESAIRGLYLAASELSRGSARALKPYGLFGLHAEASTWILATTSAGRPIRRDELAAHLV